MSTSASEDEMDASPRKVEHAKATDPAAYDLDGVIANLRHVLDLPNAVAAIERLLRERDEARKQLSLRIGD